MATQTHSPSGLNNAPIVGVGLPPAAVTRLLSRHSRQELEGFVAVAIDLLDVADGDPDYEVEDPAGETVPVIDDPDVPPEEDEGDPDLEEADCEDSFVLSSRAVGHGSGPGCTISDPDAEHDGREVTGAEDDFMIHAESGPGCPISDPGIADSGAMQDAYGGLGGASYGIDQTQSLGSGHQQ